MREALLTKFAALFFCIAPPAKNKTNIQIKTGGKS